MICHMGQGPYGPRPPRPIWARAHMGPGPFLVGRTPHQKTHPGKKSPNCVFCVFFENKKDARRLYDHFGGGIAPRSLLCVRKQRFPFLKTDLSLSVSSSVIYLRNLLPNYEPSDPTSTCAGGQDDVSSQANSLK